jgi:membrane dipeptidase
VSIVLLFDAHLDLALNGVDWNRDLRQDVDDIRVQEISLGMTNELGRGTNTLSFPELRKAEIGFCLTTLLARQEKEINHPMGWTSPEACYAMAHAHLAYYRAMERAGYLRMLKTKSDLDHQLTEYQYHPQTQPLGFVLTMEGADPMLTPDTVFEFHELGLRAMGLTHYGGNRYGGGTRTEIGLAYDAVPLLKNMAELGMTVDMTHLSDKAFWQVLDLFPGRIHASHQNSRRICNWQRQFSDEQYQAIIDRDGVIGMAFDVIMLQPGFVRGKSKPEMTMARAVENIDLICQMAGNTRHVGIGSDLDGGYGYEQTPSDLNKISDLQKIPEMLIARGYSQDDVEAIMHKNWLQFFGEVLK